MTPSVKEALDDVAWLRKNYEFDSEEEQADFSRIRAFIEAQASVPDKPAAADVKETT